MVGLWARRCCHPLPCLGGSLRGSGALASVAFVTVGPLVSLSLSLRSLLLSAARPLDFLALLVHSFIHLFGRSSG